MKTSQDKTIEYLILARLTDKIDLVVMETLLIKQSKNIINIQTDNFNRTLTVFEQYITNK